MQTIEDVHRAAQAGDSAAQELLAAVFEQHGRPAEAAGWLSRAADAGRPSAVARLGLWRLVGFGVDAAPAAGAAQIFAAAGAGDPFGLSLASIIDAGGVGVPRNLPRALEWLVRAAEAGDARAAGQLALLANDGAVPASLVQAALTSASAAGFEPARAVVGAVSAEGRPDWDALAAAANLSAFEAPIDVRLERESPRIQAVPDLLPAWACRYVMALAAPALTRGKVVDETGGESVRSVRSNSVMNFGLVDSDVILELINQRVADAAGMPTQNAEGLGVLHYAPGERYAPHVDYIADTPQNAAQLAARGQRVRTLLVYLNEGFEGGATEFPRLSASFKPPAGSALIFDSVRPDGSVDPMTLHTGAPPTSGEKWVISKWFRTRALRPGPSGAPA